MVCPLGFFYQFYFNPVPITLYPVPFTLYTLSPLPFALSPLPLPPMHPCPLAPRTHYPLPGPLYPLHPVPITLYPIPFTLVHHLAGLSLNLRHAPQNQTLRSLTKDISPRQYGQGLVPGRETGWGIWGCCCGCCGF
jgi:hypothetical protein